MKSTARPPKPSRTTPLSKLMPKLKPMVQPPTLRKHTPSRKHNPRPQH